MMYHFVSLNRLTPVVATWLASLMSGVALQQTVPGTTIDITSLLVQIPLVGLVVWIINTRDKQWREMIDGRDQAWQKMMIDRDSAWRETISAAHDQGTESVGKALDTLGLALKGINDRLDTNSQILSNNAIRLADLTNEKKRPGR